MDLKKMSRQLLSSFLVVALGLTSSVNAAFANDDKKGTDWEKVENADLDSLKKKMDSTEETNLKDTDQVRAMIVFKDASVIDKGYSTKNVISNFFAMNYKHKLEAKQEEMTEVISQQALDGKDLEVRSSFTLFANAVSADVTYEDVKKIRDVEGVEDVYVLPQYEKQVVEDADPNTATSGEMVGSYNTWLSGYTGAGMRIAIIDTGLDTDHPSYDEDAFEYALKEQADKDGVLVDDYDLLTKEDIAAVLDELHAKTDKKNDLTADDLYLNSKVPFAFNYVDGDLDVTHDNDTESDHGTHVAGISAANKYVPSENGFETQANGVVGVAPNSQLMVMKVFGKRGGAYADDYMLAIQDAILLGADAVNLSLGSPNGGESKEFYKGDAYVNDIMNRLSETDTVVTMSSGNDGAWADYSFDGGLNPKDVNMQTNGSPGSYTNSFTVASAENAGSTGYAVTVADLNIYYTETTGYSNAPFISLDKSGEGVEYDYVLLDGFGTEEDYEGLDVTGKIVFVSRGEISFFEKHDIAGSKGAAGVFVYNNAPGTISMDLSGSKATIPCASITQADGLAVKEKSEFDGKAYTGKITVSSKVTTTYFDDRKVEMSDFSSWGVPSDLTLKPEITAPGGNIYSTLTDGQYGLMSGTSMASPSVAGMSALVIEYIERNGLSEKTGLSSRVLAQALLMGTAVPLVEADGEEYSPRNQGSGLANVEYATTTPGYILMKNGSDGKVKAELGDDPDRTGKYSFGFTLYNLSDDLLTYTIDSSILTEDLVDGLIVGTSKKLNPVVDVEGASLLYDFDKDADVDQDDALVLLKYVNGSLSDEYIASNENRFDFNADGVVNTVDVHVLLTMIANGDVDEMVLTVDDKKDVTVTITLSDADKKYLDDSFANGMYIDGFVYLKGDVDLSIPMLAFYGNWADASMFEHIHPLNPTDEDYTYSGVDVTNVFVDSDGYILGGNSFADDDEYLPERNAISSEFGNISTAYFTLIRNSVNTKVVVQDKNTKEVYKSVDLGQLGAEFYYEANQKWMWTLNEGMLNWAVTDKEGQPLPEGCEVEVKVIALPHYYENGDDTSGKGVSFNVPFTVDNTAPTLKDVQVNDDGTVNLVVSDNHYTASVLVFDKNMENVLDRQAVNQTSASTDATVQMSLPKAVVNVVVVDYAGNMTTYRVNNSGVEDTKYPTGIRVNPSELTMYASQSANLKVEVEPASLEDDSVTWTSSDPSVVSVDRKGNLTALKMGNAVVTATTVATDKDGKQLSAECHVTVEDINQNFVGLSLSGNGFSWAKFDARHPENYQVVSSQLESYFSATPYGNYVVACTTYGQFDYFNKDTLEYVDTFGTLEGALITDMTTASSYSGNLAAAAGQSILWINLSSGEVLEFDTSKVADFNGAELSGIAYLGLTSLQNETYEAYAVTTTDGKLYYIFFGLTNGMLRYGEILSTGDTFSPNAGSLFYNNNADALYWSVVNEKDQKTHMYLQKSNSKVFEEIGMIENGYLFGLLDGNTLGSSANQNFAFKGSKDVELVDVQADKLQKRELTKSKGVNNE